MAKQRDDGEEISEIAQLSEDEIQELLQSQQPLKLEESESILWQTINQ